MNKSKISVAIINCVTALVCCVAVAVAGSSITKKICDNQKEIATASASAGESADNVDDYYSDGDYADASADVTGDTAADGTVSTDDVSADGSADTATAGDSASDSASSGSSSQSAGSASTSKVITATSGLQSTDKAEVLKYYQLVAAKNEKKTYKTTMTLKSLNGGSGFVGSVISAFESIAKKALDKNSTENQGVPGVPEKIKVTDWKSATAVNDGTYTTLNIQVVPQTDGPNGKVHEGTVGRSISVLDGVQAAVDQLDGFSADFENGKLALNYKNAYIKVKIKNSTGEFVKGACEWHHEVNVDIDHLEAKMGAIPLKLQGAKGVVDYKVNY
ncbi:MAG: hypothetical protein ACI4RB_03505 [Acutalibacteraceae bacterium]